MAEQPRKNIVLIVMDDANAYWRFKSVFGEQLQTPNLDRICAVSTAFHAAFCQVAACGPSRASLMSGLAPHQTGIFDTYRDIFELIRPDQMWSYRLKQAGYFCSSAGKIHHGYRPQPHEVQVSLYSRKPHWVRFGPRRDAPHRDYGGAQMGIGTTDPKDDKRYYDHQSADDAMRFFDSYDRPAPFYREIGFHNPHTPLKTPARFKDMYDHTRFTMPNRWKGWRDLASLSRSSFGPNMNLDSDEHWQKTLRNYFSAISHVDWHIGRVWDALKASRHADNTVLIITADHGYHVGDKSRFRKFSLWEEADGVPLIIHDPTTARENVVTDPVALVDVGPTVMDYAGLPPIEAAVGRSLRPQIQGQVVQGRAVPTFFFGSAGVRKGDYRYIKYLTGEDQLADLTIDPWQLDDAGDDPQRPAMAAALKQATQDFGLTMLDKGETVAAPTHYVAPVIGAAHPLSPPTLGIISYDPPDPRTLEVPGNRRYYIRHTEDMAFDLPRAYRQLCYACDVGASDKVLAVRSHDAGSHIDLVATHPRCDLRVTCGRGDDVIETLQDRLHVTLTAGRNTVLTGTRPAHVQGGSGQDQVVCRSSEAHVIGGAGDLTLRTLGEAATIRTAAGQNQLTLEAGQAVVQIARGQSRIDIATPGPVTLILSRTGLPQVVSGFRAGSVDLSDWQPMGTVAITAEGDDTVVTCGSERVVFLATDPGVVQGAIAA
ncbi:sulfatase-like hydrolase/transferase [Paracoccus sp. p4-l81]|uniref:sulfatase-like hydrolase/transferase n=1 Tax=Paracoccus sp. p4-l81 TaxID=3342806 RepID=UPI0035B6B8ED